MSSSRPVNLLDTSARPDGLPRRGRLRPMAADADLASWLRLTLTPGVGPRTARLLLKAFGSPGGGVFGRRRRPSRRSFPARWPPRSRPDPREAAIESQSAPGRNSRATTSSRWPTRTIRTRSSRSAIRPSCCSPRAGATCSRRPPSPSSAVATRHRKASTTAKAFARALSDAGTRRRQRPCPRHRRRSPRRWSRGHVEHDRGHRHRPRHRVSRAQSRTRASHRRTRRDDVRVSRSAPGRSRTIFRAAIASSAGSRAASWWWRPRSGAVRSPPPGSRPNRDARCSRFPDPFTRRSREAATRSSSRVPSSSRARRTCSKNCTSRTRHPTQERDPPATLDPLLSHLGHDPCDLDTLAARSGLGIEVLSARLLELELEGLVASLPGGRYQRLS